MPILVLSAVGDEDQKVRALEAGADDYVTKPFGPRELVARLRAILRRAAPAPGEPVIRADGLEVDLGARVVRRDGAEIHLTPIEFELLRTLVRNRGRLLTHRALLQEVWGPGYAEDVADAAHQHRPPAAQDRAGGRAPAHPHRPGRRLPLRVVTKSSCRRAALLCGRHGRGSRVIGMDIVAILIAVAAFALLLALVEGLDRV